ncbi:ATP-binding protein [Phytoactinopolyspora endophytica]|uniref:ATP-binding protein n=1 Tax=Phytoactinopolyspora endophytica TaxID=1642495 RepID=UPI00101D6187|nr:ATP-binding protein [Phytoactinopolyspora endophytica]
MSFQFLGPDPTEAQLNHVLTELANGRLPHDIEKRNVDVKEEPGRRGPGGVVQAGATENEDAAKYMAGELACLANTPGGGALIVGVADDGLHVGTDVDAEWLRHRIYQLSDRRLTVDIREVDLNGTRLLVLRVPEAVEPIRWHGRIQWRVNDNCVEVDAATWMSGRLHRSGFDWSAQPSGYRLEDLRGSAMEVARRFLSQAANDPTAADLSSATDEDLLRRLNVVDGDGNLTNAGALLFVETPSTAIDYIRRDHPGGDSTVRIRGDGSLLSQLAEVETAAAASNRVVHLPDGLVRGQVRALPPSAIREAIVNGVVHREWPSDAPVVVEHVGDTLTVTSPGGFIGGVTPANIISHPSVPRYRSLAEAAAALRLAEREGTGVDRMVADMLALGHRPPDIAEVDGPFVRAVLIGGTPNREWTEILAASSSGALSRDVDLLLLLDHLSRHGWVDATRAAPVLQRREIETEAAIGRLADVTVNSEPVIVPVAGVPDGEPSAWRPSDVVREKLPTRLQHVLSGTGRERMILDWARARGRVSSTEVADLAGVATNYAGKLLGNLEAHGYLQPGRANRSGRGFFYRLSTT